MELGKTMKNLRRILLTILLLVMGPPICYADGIVPLTNLFSKETFVGSSIVLVIIFFLEAFLLKRSIKEISFKKHLLFSVIINILSSGAGSLLMLVSGLGRFYLLFSPLVIVALFIITLITEFFPIKFLYRKFISLKRVFIIYFKINTISYVSIFALQFIFIMGFLSFSGLADKDIEKKWTHKEILNGEIGYIYTTEYASEDSADRYGTRLHNIKRYNVKMQKWEKIGSQVFQAWPWDISGNTLACIVSARDEREGKVSIFSIPEFNLINTLSTTYKNFNKIRLDHSGKYLAVIGDYNFLGSGPGIICKMSIFKVETGEKVLEYDYIFDDGIDWSPDSSKIIFSSLRDKKLFDFNKNDIFAQRKKLSTEQRRPYIYVYDLVNNSTVEICQGLDPQWSPDGRKFLFRKGIFDGNLYCYSLVIKKEELLAIKTYISDYRWSPIEQNIVARIPYSQPLPERSRLAIINLKNPNLKFIIEPDAQSIFTWTE